MLGDLPQQGIDTPYQYNGFQMYLGAWKGEAGNFLKLVVENVKGGGKFGTGDFTTWKPIISIQDYETKANGKSREYLQKALDDAMPALNQHVGLGGGSVTPPFPSSIMDQFDWLIKYATTFNPAIGKFTVA